MMVWSKNQEVMSKSERKEDAAADLPLSAQHSVSNIMKIRLYRREKSSPAPSAQRGRGFAVEIARGGGNADQLPNRVARNLLEPRVQTAEGAASGEQARGTVSDC